MGRPSGTDKQVPHVDVFRALAMQDSDITLFDLPDALAAAEGVTVHRSAIAGLLKRLGFTHEKSSVATRAAPRKGRTAARRPGNTPFARTRAEARSRCVSGRNGG